jgi:hypothetical protein
MLQSALIRPQMYAACDRDLPHFYDLLINTALFLDDSEWSIKSLHQDLSQRGLHQSPLGLSGDLSKRYVSQSFHTKIAALYLPFAHLTGLFAIDSQLSRELWDELRSSRSAFAGSDITFDEIKSKFGCPATQLGGGYAPTVFYVGPDSATDWVTLHFSNPWVDNKPSFGENPILGSMWLPTKSFVRGLIFTPFGAREKAA